MSDKPDGAEEPKRVGILRKRDTPAGSSSASSSIRTGVTSRPKPTFVPKARIKPVEDTGSIFTKRAKMIREKPATAPATQRFGKNALSTSHSNTTIDSRITATSQSSVTHKPGQLPSYLRNKPPVGSKNLIAMQVQCNKKQYNQIKKELTNIQNKAVDYYKRYRDSLVKLNKLNGKDEALTIEELKIVDFSENEEGGAVGPTNLAKKMSLSKLKQITNENVLGQISQQVQTIQVYSFKMLQDFCERLSEINNQMKTADNSESGDTNIFPDKIQNLFEEIEKKIEEEELQQGSRIASFITNLKEVMINEEGTPVLLKGSISEEYENFKRSSELKISELENKNKELQSTKAQNEQKNIELTKALANEQFCVNELKCVIAQFEAKRDEKEKEIERLSQRLKQFEMATKRFEKLCEGKNNEIAIKDKSIEEFKANSKSMQEKLLKATTQCQKTETKLARQEEQSKTQMDILKVQYEEQVKVCNQFRKELNEANLKITDGSLPLCEENERLKLSEKALEKEVYSLKLSLNEMMQTRNVQEASTTEEQVYRREVERLEAELNRLKTTISELKEDRSDREIQIAKKNRDIMELEVLVKQLEQRDKSNDYKVEVMKLQDLNNQKTKENEQLQHDLNKALTELRLQEDSLFMQQRLLKIRSELIQSLQENEDASKNQLAELNSEIDKQSYVAKQVKLSQDMSTKTEELENLFATLGAKNLEVQRQDHIIRLLEETHERNQRIRVKQEEKIARLENEIAELKQFMFTSVDGARAREKSWNNLATDLNGLGGASKDGSKWRKFWMDQKLYAKDRDAQLVAVQNKSGINGTKVPKPLTDIEERILSIMTPQAVDGDVGVAELGEQQQRIPQLNSTESQSTVIQYDSIEYLAETGNNFSTPTTSEIIDITILPHIDDQITQLLQPKKTTPRPSKKAKKNSTFIKNNKNRRRKT